MANEIRLIDANALIERCKEIAGYEWNHKVSPVSWADAYEQFADDVDAEPTVDAVPVVHGEWSTIEDDYCGLVALHCSVCDQEWWFEEDAPIKHYHYCPNCGASMKDGDGNG